MRYAIIEDSLVANIAIADMPLFDHWVEIAEDSTIAMGDIYNSETGEFNKSVNSTAILQFDLGNLVITRNSGNPVAQNGNKYYLDPIDTIEVTAEIVNSVSDIQDTIDAPVIKLPVTKHADDFPTNEEFYLSGNITAGVLTVSGSFPLSGNYKVLSDRTNRALDRMPAGFHVSFEDIDFLV